MENYLKVLVAILDFEKKRIKKKFLVIFLFIYCYWTEFLPMVLPKYFETVLILIIITMSLKFFEFLTDTQLI